jgi:hypothetical protein
MPHRKTKRHDGRFTFTLRYVDPITGERKRAYFYGWTQAKAEGARRRSLRVVLSVTRVGL